jgi:hypothetical protein
VGVDRVRARLRCRSRSWKTAQHEGQRVRLFFRSVSSAKVTQSPQPLQ